jgi:hypothetical protein
MVRMKLRRAVTHAGRAHSSSNCQSLLDYLERVGHDINNMGQLPNFTSITPPKGWMMPMSAILGSLAQSASLQFPNEGRRSSIRPLSLSFRVM